MGDALLLILAVLVILAAARHVYLVHLDVAQLKREKRALNYELMQVSIRWQVDHDRLVGLIDKQRAKYSARMAESAKEIASLKAGVEEALELLARYRAHGVELPETPLPQLRDQLSTFGHLMEAGPTEPADLTERSEWGGFK